MNYRQQHKAVQLQFRGVDVVLKGVTFYPAVGSTDVDPPEPAFAEWDAILVGGVEVSELFSGQLGEDLEDELIGVLEAA